MSRCVVPLLAVLLLLLLAAPAPASGGAAHRRRQGGLPRDAMLAVLHARASAARARLAASAPLPVDTLYGPVVGATDGVVNQVW